MPTSPGAEQPPIILPEPFFVAGGGPPPGPYYGQPGTENAVDLTLSGALARAAAPQPLLDQLLPPSTPPLPGVPGLPTEGGAIVGGVLLPPLITGSLPPLPYSAGDAASGIVGSLSLRSLFGVRNKVKPTAALERQLLGRYYGSLGRVVGRGIESVVRNFGKAVSPSIDKLRAAAKPLSTSKALSTIVEPASRFPWLGILGGLIGGYINPTDLGSGTLYGKGHGAVTHADAVKLLESKGRIQELYDNPADPIFYKLNQINNPALDMGPTTGELRGNVGQQIRRAFNERLQERVRRSKQQLGIPTPGVMGPPSPASKEATKEAERLTQSPVGAPGSIGKPKAQTKAKVKITSRIGLIAGIGVGILVAARRHGGAGSVAAPILTTSPNAPGAAIAPPPSLYYPPASLYSGSAPLATFAGHDAGCSCKRKRGVQRKCLERAGVVYKGGRYKGKAAGTKCLRYAT